MERFMIGDVIIHDSNPQKDRRYNPAEKEAHEFCIFWGRT